MPGEGAHEEDPYAEDWDLDDDPDDVAPPYWFPGQHLPEHARRMGLTHHVPDGALLDFAGSLDASKPRHLITAWVMLAVFALPVVLYVVRLFYTF
jgi:hypothetical protein